MNIPSLNIVMAFDTQVIDILKTSQSLEALEENTKDMVDILVFRNGPASHFLSLNHELGWGGGTDVGTSVRLEIEFLDPESKFEEGLLTMDPGKNMPPKARMASQELKRLEKQLEEERDDVEQNKRILSYVKGDTVFARELRKEIKVAEREMDAARDDLAKFKSVIESVGGIANFNKLRLLEMQAANQSLTQRPVWVTYGAGNDFRNWSPVLCFDKALEMNYGWTGDGVRKLKIVYDGVGISPNLTSLGISPLKALGIGAIMKGQSARLFNKKANDEEKDKYKKVAGKLAGEVDKVFAETTNPSIHRVLTRIFKEYIVRGTGYQNVVIAFPDFDTLLANAKANSKKRSEDQIAEVPLSVGEEDWHWNEYALGIAAWRDLVETFGLSFVESTDGERQIPVGVDGLRAEEVSSPEEVGDYFNSKVFRTVLVSDGYSDLLNENRFMAPLIRCVDKIIKQIVDGGELAIDWTFRTEHDYDTLHAMAKAGMIDDPNKPALIFGSTYFIDKWIYAREVSTASPQNSSGKGKKENPLGKANVLDQVFGFNSDYLAVMEKIIHPTPWATPFGPAGDIPGVDDFNLEEDTNIVIDSVKDLSDKEKLNLLIFTLGTKNTNILDFNIDINNQYLDLINSFTYQTLTASQFINAVVSKDKADACTGLLAQIRQLQLDAKGDEIPQGFIDLVQPWLVITEGSEDEDTKWGAIFGALGIGASTAEERNELDISDYDAKMFGQNFVDEWEKDEDRKVKYYWDRFKTLTEQFPKPSMEFGGKGVDKSAINHANMVADGMATYGFTGSMKTLPMFHLSNGLRVQNRDALLYCVEPRIFGLSEIVEERDQNGQLMSMDKVTPDLKYANTWFSGMYVITAFKHSISGGNASSEFKFYRAPGRSMRLGNDQRFKK
tara:strand:+ start:5141 stop:7825 length:2685 start_codon:yes stop_codon:yes gene_type:complete